MGSPTGNATNDIHDYHKPSNWGSNVEIGLICMQDLPKLGLGLNGGTSHTCMIP